MTGTKLPTNQFALRDLVQHLQLPACGIVIHPAIDACAQLRSAGCADEVERIELRVHSLVLELTGKKEPKDGLEAKFSVYHGCAAGLLFGQAGEAEFADEVVARDDVVAARRKVVATVDPAIDEAAVRVTAVLRNGERRGACRACDRLVAAAIDRRRPGAQICRAGRASAGAAAVGELTVLAWSVGRSADLQALVRHAVPA